jgi:outer membrane protein OmpA-like peptidoglycan-associated protein
VDECPGTPRGQKVDERGCAVLKLVLADVYFKFNTATIRDFYYPFLGEVARSMRADNNLNVVIELEGHTDSVGSFEYNYKLADRRAKAVKEYLVAQGISPNRLVTSSRGEADPAAPNSTAEGRARNRRVEMLPRGPNLDPRDIIHYRIMLRDAYFDTDEAVVRDDVKGFLSEVARVMVERRFAHVKIELQGYADVRRANDYNMELSERRAQAVKEILVANGLSPRRISVVPFGEEKATSTTAKGMQEDRRVEVHARQ